MVSHGEVTAELQAQAQSLLTQLQQHKNIILVSYAAPIYHIFSLSNIERACLRFLLEIRRVILQRISAHVITALHKLVMSALRTVSQSASRATLARRSTILGLRAFVR